MPKTAKRKARNRRFPGLPHYTGPRRGIFGLLHHDQAIEYSYDVMERVKFVNCKKSKHELATRLRAMVYVAPRLLPKKIVKAVANFKTRVNYAKALADFAPEINALLARLVPDCPWNGRTMIFP